MNKQRRKPAVTEKARDEGVTETELTIMPCNEYIPKYNPERLPCMSYQRS